MSDWGPFSLEGNIAVITGGALGIGYGIAKRYVEAGAKVLIADMNEQAAKAAAAKLGANAHAMRADVSKDGEAIVAHCVDIFGSIDILVNNAGIYPFATMNELTPELFDKVIAVNLKGAAFCAKAAATQMIQQGNGGRIINIASIDGFHPSMIGLIAYDSSKGGVIMLTRSLALELAPLGIQVNGIAPGGIRTEGTGGEAMDPEVIKGFESKIPMRRMGIPDDIGTVAVFLASDASRYMCGDIVIVDGGVLLA